MTNDLPGVIQLRAAGVAAVFDVGGQQGAPRLLHWGADLGELSPAGLAALLASSTPPVLNSSFDVPRRLGLTPGEHGGWSGSPGVEGHRDGAHAALRFEPSTT